ncbi:MAG: beta-1,6-N-acetylglucosaminyltransferase [Bacteroidales bacterium]|jgi:hypothetical protein|nr:beta-1,6-N-acetylglucosaminyltransferase [Bacteroidales bacterium]
MKVAYLILAHHEPEMLDKLISVLNKPKEQIFVHLDKKTDIIQFQNILEEKCIFIEERLNVSWGSFSMINAELNLLRIAFEADKFDYYCLLSGCDLPIKPIHDFENYLIKNQRKEFILCAESSRCSPYFQKRYKGFYFFENRNKWLLTLNYGVTKIQRFFYKRKPYNYQLMYFGSQWWTLSGNFIEYVLNFLEQNPAYTRYFRYTLIPDEMFFQTIIAHSPFFEQVTDDNLRLIHFTKNIPNPIILTIEDKDVILQSKAFFARKFDLRKDKEIIDFLFKCMISKSKFVQD